MIVGTGRGNNGPVTPCEACPLRKRPSLREFTPEELAFVKEFKTDEMRVDAGATSIADSWSTVTSGVSFRTSMA